MKHTRGSSNSHAGVPLVFGYIICAVSIYALAAIPSMSLLQILPIASLEIVAIGIAFTTSLEVRDMLYWKFYVLTIIAAVLLLTFKILGPSAQSLRS